MSKDKPSIKILKAIGTGALIAVVATLSPAVIPKLIQAYFRHRQYKQRQIQNSLDYLKRKKFIAYEYKEGKVQVLLTHLGRRHLAKLEAEDVQIKKVPWDNLWRIVMFDIPEEFKPARHVFRHKLQELQFYHFQRSVFVCPYPCERELRNLARLLRVNAYVHIVTAQRFPSDQQLLKFFKL